MYQPQVSPIDQRTLPKHLLAAFTLILIGLPASAEEYQLTLDPETTKISFHLDATGHDIEGRLYLDNGSVTFDPEAGTARGEIHIDATRTESGNTKRDKKMHHKVLESIDHPLIVFVPDHVEGTFSAEGSSQLDLIGTVTLLGKPHNMVLSISAEISGSKLAATSTFTVPYIDWGLHNPSLLILRVAKEVEVTVAARGSILSTEGTVAKAGQP